MPFSLDFFMILIIYVHTYFHTKILATFFLNYVQVGKGKELKTIFSKLYGKVGVIIWFLFHLIWKNYVLYWDLDLKSWIVDFFTRFTCEKTPQYNFSSQNFSVENNFAFHFSSDQTSNYIYVFTGCSCWGWKTM